MRICSPELGISPYANLGGEVYDREVLKGLANLGAKIEILLPKNKLHERVKNWNVQYAPLEHIYPPYIYNLVVLPYLKKTWARRKFDVLRVHSPYYVGSGALLFRKVQRAKIPIVATYHHLEKRKTFNLIDKLLITRFDKIITISEFTKTQTVSKFGISPERISIVSPGISEKLKPLKKDRVLVEKYKIRNKIVLLYLGVLTERKNPLFLLDSFSEILKENKNVVLLVCGSGKLYSDLIKRARKLQISKNVIFTGPTSEEDKIRYYNLADIFVFPSKLEGFGMVAGEAMRCGKPVVASNAAAIPEVVGDAGLLADPSDERDFANKILRLVEDEKLRKKLGKKGRERIRKNFTWELAAKRTLEVYESLL